MVARRRLLQLCAIVMLAVGAWFAGRATRTRVTPVVARAPTPSPFVHAAEAPALPAVAAVEQHHPRPLDEWQGMLVDLTARQYCEASSYCGFALACLDDNRCGACSNDAQCATGEACVLDHCVRAANVGCRARSDCAATGDDALCILSGLTGGEPRGNGDMRSYCQASSGGIAQDPSKPDPRRAAQLAAAAAQVPVAPPVSAEDLRARLDRESAP